MGKLAPQVVVAQIQFRALFIFPLWMKVLGADPQDAPGQNQLGTMWKHERLILEDLLNISLWEIQDISKPIHLQLTTMLEKLLGQIISDCIECLKTCCEDHNE